MNGFPSPFTEVVHFDLLPLSRRLWRRRLESRSLKDIETEVIGFARGQMEVPGWEIPVLYFNYLRTGDPTQMAGVFYHNAIDIQSLAALFLYINKIADKPDESSTLPSLDLLSMAVQLEATGEIDKAVSLYDQLLTTELPEAYSVELHLRYARILKQNGRFDQAVSVLNNGGELKNIHVLIQMAKVLEHQRRDHTGALEWTEKALNLLETSKETLAEATFNQHVAELTKRKKRLLQKIERAAD
jgi:tetratricopeptide (TPR) repeat protein